MKKYILSGALILGLSGLTAVAQTSTTPGMPSSNDPQYQAPAPDNQQYPSDRDSSTDRQRQRDQGTYNTDQDRQDQSNSDIRRDRDSDRDRLPQSDQDSQQQTDRDRQGQYNDQSNRTGNDHDRDRQGVSGDYRNQIQSALSQANLNNVMVNDNDSRIELTGTVDSGRDRRQAIDIAQQYANGRRVVDHIKVRGQGNDQDGHDRDRQDH